MNNEKNIEGKLNDSGRGNKKDIILNTDADPICLDLNKKDEDVDIDGILTLKENFPSRTNITCSFRISSDLIEHFKDVARKVSFERREDINWQKLIIATSLEKYPIKNQENKYNEK